jgi:hypothetical protein
MGSKVQRAFFLSMVVAVNGWSQSTTASLLGVVRDKTGAAIPETQVTAQNVLTSFTRATVNIVYFPWDIDRLYWEVMSEDHGLMLRNAIEWATNEAPPVKVTGQGMLDVTVWRQNGSMTVHLVNLTNELIPSPPQAVRVRLPDGAKASRVQLLVAGGSPAVQRTPGHIDLTVPSILDHEVIAIDLA